MSNIMQLLETQSNIFTILAFFLFLFFIYKFLFNTKIHLPPSPPKLPIIGNLHQIDKKLPHRSLQNLSKTHGEFMLLHYGKKPVLVVSSAEAACQIMKTHDIIFADRPALRVFKRLHYDCKDVAVAPYGEYWRRVRSVCVNQLLNYNRVKSFQHVRDEEIAQLIKEIGKSKRAVDLSKIISNYSTDVICRAAFGMKFNGERDGIDFKELHADYEELAGSVNVGDFIPWLSWIVHVNGVEKKIKRVSRDMDKFLDGLVQEHMDILSKFGGRNIVHEKTQDFIDVLLELQQDQKAETILDRESMKAVTLNMFVAGSTTTLSTLEWAMSELLLNPSIMEKLKKEVRSITKEKPTITENDLEKMEYLKAVIKETFRLHPAVPLLLPRISTRETKLNGYDIPARTQVIVNAWAIHRDPTVWNEPEEFNPERFMNSAIDYKGQHFNLIPFGSGRRGCPGILFGMANIELVLATLMQIFDWELPEGKTLDMMEHPGLSVHRNVPLVAIATPVF